MDFAFILFLVSSGFVQVSLTSSCEIVEALEDAVNDVNEAAGDLDNSENKESSPPVELSWINDSSMTASQYAQVIKIIANVS